METSVHLAVERFVLRNCVGGNVPDGVCFLVSDLLLRDLSLSDACTLSRVGSVALLNLVWMRSQRHGGWSLAQLLRTEPHYFNWEFSQVLSAVTAKGDFALVQWVLHHFPGLPIAETIVQSAAKEGKLWLLQLFEADKPHRDIEWGKKSYLKAARKGHWEVTRWLLPRCQVSYESRKQVSTLVRSATNQLNMKELKWALANGFSIKKANMIYPPMHPKLRELFEARILEEHRRGPDDTLEKQWTDMSKMIWYMTEEELVAFSIPEWRLPARYGDLPFLKLLASKQRNRDHRLDIAIRVGALKVAAEKGHLGIVKWLLATFSDLNESAWLSQAIFAAAESDEIEVVRWLYYKCSREPKVTLFLKHDIYVLDSESVNEVDFGDSSDDDSDSDWEDFNEDEFNKDLVFVRGTAMDVAAQYGHLEVLEFLQSVNTAPPEEQYASNRGKRGDRGGRIGQGGRNPYCTTVAMDLAAAAGRLSIVKWLHTNRTEGCTTAAMDHAAANGHLEVVKWLHFNRAEGCTTSAIDDAVAKCFVEGPVGDETSEARVNSASFATPVDERRFEIIQFLHSNRTEGCTSAAMTNAVGNGNLMLLQWLHFNTRARCTKHDMDKAAAMGRLDIVQWLHENCREGCTTAAMDGAAAAGYLGVVQWLHENRKEGCTTEAIDEAAANGELEVVKWLCENREEGCTPDAIEEAAQNGDLLMVKILHNVNRDRLVINRGEHAMFILELLGECDVDIARNSEQVAVLADANALREAAATGQLHIVQWLAHKVLNVDTMRAMCEAFISANFFSMSCCIFMANSLKTTTLVIV